MNRVLKIFATGSDQDAIADKYPVVERYEGFLLVDVPEEMVKPISRKMLAEDITDQYAIRAGTTEIDTSRPRLDSSGATRTHPQYKGKAGAALPEGQHHYLVQFVGPVKDEWLAGVKKAGGELREPYGDFTYIVRADESGITAIAALPYVRWTGHLPYTARIERTVLDSVGRKAGDTSGGLPRTRIMPGVYTVEFFGPKDVTSAIPDVKKLGFDILVDDPKGRILIVQAMPGKAKRAKQINDLSAVHGVRKIRERALNRPSNDVAATIMGTARAISTTGGTGLGLSGKGEIIGICDTGIDTGNAAQINKDFENRILNIKSYPITPDFNPYIKNPGGDDGPADLDSGHGTHVAGSVLGSGANSAGLAGLSGPIRGLAFNAKLVFQAVEQEMKWKSAADLQESGRYILAGIPTDLKTLFSYAYQKGARVHSNSWGGGKPGEYDEQCRQLDQYIWDNKDFCVVVAAGNDGTDNDSDGKINLMSVTSPGTAKNCITVGACENKRTNFNNQRYGDWWPDDYPKAPFKADPMADNPDQIVAFSSRGPTRDNRFKPEIVAPGTFILSTRSSMIASNNTAWAPFPPSRKYFYMGGTSMATPLTAGAVALVREYLRTRKNIANPSAAMLKATLIAGATRLAGTATAGTIVDNHQGFGRVNLDAVLAPASPAVGTFVNVQPGLATGAAYTATVNVKSNAVPLRIVLAYTDFPGNKLINNLNLIVTGPDGKRRVGNQSGTGITLDTANNVEVVHIDKPAAGAWKIEVIASNVPHGPQDFALVYIGHV
jgi:serine protease AprX